MLDAHVEQSQDCLWSDGDVSKTEHRVVEASLWDAIQLLRVLLAAAGSLWSGCDLSHMSPVTVFARYCGHVWSAFSAFILLVEKQSFLTVFVAVG